MRYLVAAAGMALAVAMGAAAEAQSLAELARQEEARRKAIKTPAKVYTNDDVRGGSVPTPASASSSSGAAAAAPAPAADNKPAEAPAAGTGDAAAGADDADAAATAAGAERGEAYWRKRLQAERDALARAQLFAEALQSRINALSADFVARDDPAQRAVIATDRQKALAELDRVEQEIVQLTKAIAATHDAARRAGVPPGWLR